MRCDIEVSGDGLRYRGSTPEDRPAEVAVTASPTEFELTRLAPPTPRSPSPTAAGSPPPSSP